MESPADWTLREDHYQSPDKWTGGREHTAKVLLIGQETGWVEQTSAESS